MRVKDLIVESKTVSELKVAQNIGKTIQAAPATMKKTFRTGKAAAGAAAQKAGIGGGIKQAVSSFKKGFAQGAGTAVPTEPDQPAAQTEPNTEPSAAAEPAVAAKSNAQEFAQKLQTMFDQFASANGSIGAPAVKQVIKNMWMQAGGIKAESKQK